MAVVNQGNVVRFITGDVAIRTGGARIIGIVVVGGSDAAKLKLFDGVNDVTKPQVFEWGNVAANVSEGPPGVDIKIKDGISATLTGTSAVAYLYLKI